MKCIMRYIVRIIDVVPKDFSKNVSKYQIFHIKPKIQISNEDHCGMWLICFK